MLRSGVPARAEDNSSGLRSCLPGHLLLLLAASAILLTAWSLIVPIFEAPDEPHHWEYARYIHDHWRLPIYDSTMVEANQPPLYYYLIAPVSAQTNLPSLIAQIDKKGNFNPPCPPRIFKECLSDFRSYWPLRWARLLTSLFSVVTVLFTYLAAYEAAGNRYTALLAGGLVTFLPQFAFRGTNISNDAMVATTSAVATYSIVRLIRRGFSWRAGYIASVCVAVAFLSKISAIIFVPVLVLALLFTNSSWRRPRFRNLIALLPGVICVVPWLVRNQRLYGDVLASGAMLRAVPLYVHKKAIWSPYFVDTFPHVLAESFVGVFGWMNIYLPAWIYYIYAAAALLGILGLVRACARRTIGWRVALALVSLPLLSVASTAQLNLTFTQPQGRYLFPALTAFAILMALGLNGFLPRWNRQMTYPVLLLFAAINLYALLGVELPAYWMPKSGPAVTTVDSFVPPNLMLGGPAGPLPLGGSFGQTFVAQGSNLTAVDIELATYRKRIPAGSVTLHLRASPQETHDLATTVVPASSIADCSFVRLSFPPISASAGKSYYIFVSADGIPAGYWLTVFTSKTDVYPRGAFFLNHKEVPGRDTSFRTVSTDRSVCGECSH